MQQGANAYAKVAQTALSGRELEAAILMKAATRLQRIRDDWEGKRADLDEALKYNRKLWTVLVTSVTSPESLLPQPIKHNIANLALFIFNQTMAVISEPKPEKLGILVSINREVAAGLRTRPQAPPTAR
jgi:flagellar biosynthesis activator protein FlaF